MALLVAQALSLNASRLPAAGRAAPSRRTTSRRRPGPAAAPRPWWLGRAFRPDEFMALCWDWDAAGRR
jgi:hypothetical protein